MANTTVRGALQIHGANPQFLVEKIIRTRIWESNYWKEHCFALTAETLIDKAIELKYIGGVYGNQRPTEFISLLLKLLQIQPEKEILVEYLLVDEFKYLRALAAMYIRMTFRPVEVFELLEPLLKDYRKLRVRSTVEAKMRVKAVKGNDGPAAGAVKVGVVVPVAFQELGVYDGAGLAAPQDQTKGGMSHEARPVQGPVQEGAALQSVPDIDPVAAISPQTGCKKTETGNRPGDLPKRASGCGARRAHPAHPWFLSRYPRILRNVDFFVLLC